MPPAVPAPPPVLDPAAIWATHYDHPHPWLSTYPPLSLVEMFEQSARANAARPLLPTNNAR